MRILWLCNMIPGLVQADLGGKAGSGLWVDHVLQGVLEQKPEAFRVLCMGTRTASGALEGKFSYAVFQEKVPYRFYPELEEQFRKELQEFKPDVIHIWGTEFGHTLAMMNACETENMVQRAVISIQGLCAFVPMHHNEGIPQKWIRATSIRDFLRRDNLAQQAETYAKRGKLEIEALKKARHVIGRTEWDRATAMQINRNLQYHVCNETMRENFYTGQWSYASCRKHRIFAPGWTDPSKGFHNLLEAFVEVLKEYPDAEIYVPGKSYYPGSWKAWLHMRAHYRYLIELTERYGLKDKIHFLGHLSAEEMKENFLQANVFVLPSSIENSPNTVCESMLLGTPCVSADVGGLMKMMIHGKEGFLYQSTAYYMLAYYIEQVFAMEEKAEQIGAAARAHAMETHDPKANMDALLAIYREVGKGTV